MRSSRYVATLGLILVIAGVCAADAAAQLYPIRHRPSDVVYYRFQRPHFTLIYQTGLFLEAQEAADLLERAYPEVEALVGLRRPLRMPVVLNHFTDLANGFVSPLPFRQEIEAVNLRGKSLSPRFHSWLETVAPHELVHAAHAEAGDGFGVGWLLRRLGPDLARSLNLSGPRGINEGAAVWLESRIRPGAGRLNYSLFEMEFRAAMLSDRPWSLVQMLEAPEYTRPFDRYYHGGAHLFEYLIEAGYVDFFRRARNFYYRFPLLGYGPALWYGTRMSPWTLERRLRAHYLERGRAFQNALGSPTEADVIASGRGETYRRPRWVDDTTLIAYVSGYDVRPGFYRIDAETGRREVISHQAITEDYSWSFGPDSASILFSRYVPSTFTPAETIAEIFRLDLDGGRATRFTEGGRAFGAVAPGRATIWALRNVTQFNEWIETSGRLDSTAKAAARSSRAAAVGALERSVIVAVEPSPERDAIALLLNHEGRQGVYRATLRSDSLVSVEPWLLFEDGSVFDVTWSRDGRRLVVAADPGGVSNLYALDVGEGRLSKLTNVPFGAIEPTVSPDGRWVAYVNYRHERYELVRVPFRPEEADEMDGWNGIGPEAETSVGASDRRGEGAPLAIVQANDPARFDDRGDVGHETSNTSDEHIDATADDPAPYRPLRNVRPRVLYPFLLYQRPTGDVDDTNLGFGVGLGVEWADPLQYWSAHTSLFYQHDLLWGRLAVQSGHVVPRPSAEVFRSPSTVHVLRRDAAGRVDTLRAGREERGAAIGVRSPIVFTSNVFQTHAHVSLLGEFRRERLFDDDNRTIRPADDHVALRPSANLSYRIQANPRDVVPNSGLLASVESRVDVWADEGRHSRWLLAAATQHIPLLQVHNIGLQLRGNLLMQNRAGIVDLTTFFPRGYETHDTFLNSGTFAKYGVEYTQPLFYIDDGLFLLPIYFKALFAYAFVETMQGIDAATERLTVAGAGFGLQFRYAHSINAALRVAPVYKFRSQEWSVTFR